MKNKLPYSKLNKNHSVFFATFSRYVGGKRYPTNGMVDPMLFFLLPRVGKLLLLDQPHVAFGDIDPIIEIFEGKKMKKRFFFSRFWYLPIYLFCKIPSGPKTRVSYKLRDFFSVLGVALTQPDVFDIFIGLEGINALAGILLKKLGKVKKVIYYVSDYSPVRFKNKLFNAFYLWLDRFCLLHADFTWDVSRAMQQGRFLAGLPEGRVYRVMHVPNGLFDSQIQSLPIAKRNKQALVYMGILESDMGPDIAIKSLSYVHKKFPQVKLHIIGGPQEHVSLMKQVAQQAHVEDSVIFHGFVVKFSEMAKIVKRCYIGLAPYRSFPNSKRWYGDAGKIRQYVASGLPVVTTQVPPLGRDIIAQGAGIMTNDTEKDFASAIVTLLSDEMMYRKMAKAAVKISKDNTWTNVYTKAFNDVLSSVQS